MTALEEKLSKTEYIYVLGFDGKPQMPTRRKRHVLKLLKTGRTNIGAAVLSPLGDLLFAAVIETRNKEIKKLMADRQKSRQASRRGERKARQRLAKRYGSMVKSGMVMRKLPMYAADKFVICKFIRNTQARFCNRKRCPDWITPTVQHLVQTHLNIIRKISRYLPVTDIADVRI